MRGSGSPNSGKMRQNSVYNIQNRPDTVQECIFIMPEDKKKKVFFYTVMKPYGKHKSYSPSYFLILGHLIYDNHRSQQRC